MLLENLENKNEMGLGQFIVNTRKSEGSFLYIEQKKYPTQSQNGLRLLKELRMISLLRYFVNSFNYNTFICHSSVPSIFEYSNFI